MTTQDIAYLAASFALLCAARLLWQTYRHSKAENQRQQEAAARQQEQHEFKQQEHEHAKRYYARKEKEWAEQDERGYE